MSVTNEKEYSFQVIEYMGTFGSEQYFTQIADGNPGVFSTSLFAEQNGITFGTEWSNPVAWGDYDKDGFLDILLPGSPCRIYHNNGDNTFTELTGLPLFYSRNGLSQWGDYDNDGDLDFIISGASVGDFSNPVTKIFRNDGAGIFTEQTQISLAGVYYSSVDWGDYDNDGDLDIMLTGATGSDPDFDPVSKIYRNNGNNTFTEQSQISLPGVFRGSALWGDYDNDGDLDILLNGELDYRYNNISKIYSNNGNNTFTEQTQIQLQSLLLSSSAWGDFDNDKDLDFLITTFSSMIIYQNLGNDNFTIYDWIGLGAARDACSAAWGDYDNDGYLDILLTNPGLDSKIFRNTRGIPWIPDNSHTYTTKWFNQQDDEALKSAGYGYVSWVDYDNDGDLDFLLAKGEKPTAVYKNNLIMKSGLFKSNTPPAAPSGLLSTKSPMGVTLKWNPVRNDETHFKTMTYNVRIGTFKDSANICPPHSASTGFRKVAAMGNAQMDTTFLLKKLASGNYYWSVQAVDQGLKGGAWSGVDSFIVKNTQAFFKTDTICQGLPTHFTDQSVAADSIRTWKWDFKDGTTAATQNPVHTFNSSGNYLVKLIITTKGNDKDSLELNVVVKLSPKTGLIAPVVCQGIATNITNSTISNGLTITTWNWNFGDGQTSTAQQHPSHGYLNAGDYLVKLKAIASNGCSDSISKNVTVANYPVAVITSNAPLSFCAGDSVVLSVAYNKNYAYQWLLNGTGLTNTDSSKIKSKQSGNYSVEVTNKIGNCKSTSELVKINVIDAPVSPTIILSGPVQFCQGDSVTLSVTNIPGNSYQWKLNGGTIGNNQNSLIAKSSGTYSLSVSNSSGCSVNSTNTVNVIVNPKPTVPTVSLSGATSFCQGGSLELSVINNPSYTYQWKNNGTNIPGATTNTFTAQNSGVYSLSISNSDGCISKTENVTVNAIAVPIAPLISASGQTQFCQGDSVTLSVTNITGNTYQWKLNGGAISNNQNSIVGKSLGVYSLTVSNSSLCSANSTNTINVIVNPRPTVPSVSISGNTSFCQGSNVVLSVPVNSTYNYQWINSGNNISGATSNSYIALNSGKYALKVSNTEGCSTLSQEVNVNVAPTPASPTINTIGSTTFCQGDSVTLSVTNITGNTYQWKLNGGAIEIIQNSLIAKSSGTYSLSVSNSSGCSVNSTNTYNVIVNPKPTVPTVSLSGAISFCQGGSVELSVINNPSYTYQWKNNGANISGATTNTFTAQNSGVYSLNISNSDDCVSKTENVTVNTIAVPIAPLISASGQTLFCQSDSVTLSVTNITGNTYQWKLNGGAIGTNTSQYTAPLFLPGTHLILHLLQDQSCYSTDKNNRLRVTYSR